jgi:two-component system chemotaxis response regulator CheB
MTKNILLVERSSLIRRYLVKLLHSEGYTVDSVKTKEEALGALLQKRYTLVVLDIGISQGALALQKILEHGVSRVVVLYAPQECDLLESVLFFGEFESVMKPQKSVDIANISQELIEKIKKSFLKHPLQVSKQRALTQEYTKEKKMTMGFVLIGASTGGPRLIEQICKKLPADYPHAVCVVQHMPTEFTTNFARRLNSICQVEVLEADNGLELKPARVIIAKGGKHLHIRKKLKKFTALLAPNTQERFFVPSVDELFFSAVDVLPMNNVLAVELTGIGDDGADGLVALRKKGAYTLAESEESAVVFGMPKEAALRGGATKVLPFKDILEEILKFGQKDAFE